MVRASIVGASGYSGGELVRLLSRHPGVEISTLTANRQQGVGLTESFPHLEGFADHSLVAPNWAALGAEADVVFLALPHGLSMEGATQVLEGGARVIDLGADFRLRDASLYRDWYDLEHSAPDLLAEAVYGLPELHRQAIASARLVACPGCYPTASILALLPLLNHLSTTSTESGTSTDIRGTIIVDAKSGVSGAGRAASMGSHFSEVNENVKPYKLGSHRHMPEIEQTFRMLGCTTPVFLSPHLIPMTRGILATCYVSLAVVPSQEEADDLWQETYRDEPFIRVRDGFPETKATVGSNFCDVAVRVDAEKGLVVGLSAIDNLIKGASGQAIQCMNLMFDLPEQEGLSQAPLYP